MLNFLNQNAGAIQAVATVILVIITCLYVRLTNRLSNIAKEELEFLRKAEQVKKSQLLAVLKTLRICLGELPVDPKDGEKIRKVTIWEDRDLNDLQQLASDLDIYAGQTVAIVINSLRWLKEQVDMVKNTNPKLGANWHKFPWEEWNKNLTHAKENIVEVWNISLKHWKETKEKGFDA